MVVRISDYFSYSLPCQLMVPLSDKDSKTTVRSYAIRRERQARIWGSGYRRLGGEIRRSMCSDGTGGRRQRIMYVLTCVEYRINNAALRGSSFKSAKGYKSRHVFGNHHRFMIAAYICMSGDPWAQGLDLYLSPRPMGRHDDLFTALRRSPPMLRVHRRSVSG